MLKMVLAGVVGLLFLIVICAAEVLIERKGDSENGKE